MPMPKSAPASGSTSTDLASRCADQMAAAWKRGERVRADAFLSDHDLSDEGSIRLIYEEACLRRDHGETGVSDEILNRFPRWQDRLTLLFECDRLMRTQSAPDFPQVGEVLGDFRVDAEIGRGSIGRTFLARQRSLADRPVVLKATPLFHEEHLSLARLRHTNIVPLYFEQAFPARRVRVIGMPYVGGTTLARALADQELCSTPFHRRTGRQMLAAIDRGASGLPQGDLAVGPFRAFIQGSSYVNVICWLGACLADALQYAHDRDLIHLDVKPSNVQLAADGQPMLLDFHLAREPFSPGSSAPDRLGGTIGCLSPEQARAMESVRMGRPIDVSLDGRSDLFSLGLLLHSALGGDFDEAQGAPRRPLSSANSEVSPGLSDIIQKCLEPEPSNRYAQAGALARDLRAHLSDQPLVGVANRSVLERWRKWRRRSPAGLARGIVRFTAIPALLATIVIGFALVRQWDREIDGALAVAKRQLHRDHYDEAARSLNRGLQLASVLPPYDERGKLLAARLMRVENERTAADLHAMVDLLRYRFSLGESPGDAGELLLRRGRDVWELRSRFTRAGAEPMKPQLERQLRTDFLDLATVWADLAAHPANGKESQEGLRAAVAMLRDAREQFGASPALSRDLTRYLGQLGEVDRSLILEPPRTAWEHYDLGRSFLQTAEHHLAEQAFRKSVELDPSAFWPQFFWGVSAYRLGRCQDAATAFSAAIALCPRSAECYYNRAKAHDAIGATELALADYSRALDLKPKLADASLNRGILYHRLNRSRDALADLEQARAHALTPAVSGLAEYSLALVHLKLGNHSAAAKCLKQAIANGNPEAQELARKFDPVASGDARPKAKLE